MNNIKSFIKKEFTFSIAFILTLLSIFLNPHISTYFEMIDFRVLILLFSLMGISAALESSKAFDALRDFLLKRCDSERSFSCVMVFLTFFASSLITNDVALIIFVPFTLKIVNTLMDEKKSALLIVLETIAANLGSMMLPVGNSQNLYLYSTFNLDVKTFFITILPYSFISALLLLGSVFIFFENKKMNFNNQETTLDKKKASIFFVLLLFSLLTVFRVVSEYVLIAVAICAFLFFNKDSFKKVDYILLLTFCCFFIFSGNLSQNDGVKSFFNLVINKSVFLVSLLTTQIISNVPSAVLLSQFTSDGVSLLKGTNIGGLGTPVASLASLITIKLYMKSDVKNLKCFFKYFIILNFIFLIVLVVFWFLC